MATNVGIEVEIWFRDKNPDPNKGWFVFKPKLTEPHIPNGGMLETEIADMLGVTRGTVAKTLFNAMKKLRARGQGSNLQRVRKLT